MSEQTADERFMSHALSLAARGEGHVEPNPMVGCAIVRDGQIVGQGWHPFFGGPHAEVEAIADAADRTHGATLYVSLEPCCHTGKTPPCTNAIVRAGIRRVVIAILDPFSQVSGNGVESLRSAGIDVAVGVGDTDARQILAPYLKRITTGHPWVIAKWAMTLDGKIATANGNSQWISGEKSRSIVHSLRGRVDAILVGRQTAARDNPLLTARPRRSRVATRIVLDSRASLPLDSALVQTVDQAPVIVAAAETPDNRQCEQLEAAGVEVMRLAGAKPGDRLVALLGELGDRAMTNVLVEGGGQLLGSFLDAGALDEVHAFVATKLVGGENAPSPIAGIGLPLIAAAKRLHAVHCVPMDGDIYVHGRVEK